MRISIKGSAIKILRSIETKENFSFRLAYVLFLLCAFAGTAAAQREGTDDVVRITTELVLLDAQVINRRTRQTVSDLRPQDFELYEEGTRQEITYFSRDELPLSVLLLLDTSNSAQPIIAEIAAGARRALEQLKPEDEVAVMAFAETSETLQIFTRDRQLVADRIAQANRSAVGGGTFLDIALTEAARMITQASNPTSRRVIIVVTDNIAFPQNEQTFNESMRAVRESGSVVYGLIVRSGLATRLNIMTLGLVRAVNPYADETGGEVIGASRREITTRLNEIIGRLRSRYLIGFRPPNTQEDDRFRRLDLRIAAARSDHNRLRVRARRGYYLRRRLSGATND
jgi:VWFA-related protein